MEITKEIKKEILQANIQLIRNFIILKFSAGDSPDIIYTNLKILQRELTEELENLDKC